MPEMHEYSLYIPDSGGPDAVEWEREIGEPEYSLHLFRRVSGKGAKCGDNHLEGHSEREEDDGG